jgi:hypothetical protein
MKYLNILKFTGIALTVAMIFSCADSDELFKREQYKHVFALLSDDGFNIFAEEHDLELSESQGYVSAVCGGSLPTTKDIDITILEDEALLMQYNRSNFDLDESQYAQWLPSDKYTIASYGIKIPAGERIGKMSIKVNPAGLSPDSVYFVPLRVDRFNSYEMNPTKSNVLYRVFMKNYYASNKPSSSSATKNSATDYSFRGKRGGVNVMGIKQVLPVGSNSVRTMAGDVSYEAGKLSIINSGSILLTVNEANNSVTISAWKDIEVTQIDDDPDYPNTFSIYDDGYRTYKTFLLRYDYTYNGTTYEMQEELRLEFKEENKY